MASSEQLIHAFRDTEDWIYQDRSLEKAVSRSIRNTVVYPQDDCPELDRARAVAHTEVSVTHRGTFQAVPVPADLLRGGLGRIGHQIPDAGREDSHGQVAGGLLVQSGKDI